MPLETEPLPQLPPFIDGRPLYISKNFQVVMGYKPRTDHTVENQRFFIEPMTEEAEKMLILAAEKHHIHKDQFNIRAIKTEGKRVHFFSCIRVDFIQENLPILLWGQIDIPNGNEDTMPSPRRMEECLAEHPQKYTFQD